MGFFNKLVNWVTGKGWKENYQLQQEKVKEEQAETNDVAEDHQYPKEEGYAAAPPQKEEPKQRSLFPFGEDKPKEEAVPTPQEKEMKKAVSALEKFPLKADVERKIDSATVNRVDMGTISQDIAQLRPSYERIFTDGAKLSDPDILNILIQNRQQLQHRFSAEFRIYGKIQGEIGVITVSGILFEHTSHIYNFLRIGQDVDKSTFGQLMDQAISSFETTFGAIGGSKENRLNHNDRITDIVASVTFA